VGRASAPRPTLPYSVPWPSPGFALISLDRLCNRPPSARAFLSGRWWGRGATDDPSAVSSPQFPPAFTSLYQPLPPLRDNDLHHGLFHSRFQATVRFHDTVSPGPKCQRSPHVSAVFRNGCALLIQCGAPYREAARLILRTQAKTAPLPRFSTPSGIHLNPSPRRPKAAMRIHCFPHVKSAFLAKKPHKNARKLLLLWRKALPSRRSI
jgi:hypothetical protein